MPYDMLDGGVTLEKSIQCCLDQCALQGPPNITVTINLFHTASIFGPTKTPIETAKQNVQGTKDTIQTLARVIAAATATTTTRTLLHAHLILTSSMAAVRGPGQQPSNKSYFTSQHDWNTISTCGTDSSWGMCYQWSKMYSERLAWKLCDELNISMTSLCPSFIIGPLLSGSLLEEQEHNLVSLPYSLELIKSWLNGDSPVQSRLFVDVRDVAAAHVAAATTRDLIHKNSHSSKYYRQRRYLVSTERRIPAQEVAHTLLKIIEQEQEQNRQQQQEQQITIKKKMYCDDKFDGGYIPIGQIEVLTSDILRDDLGVTCRPIQESLIDTARQLLLWLK
jgi:nucleoside-diphosphate-sugar epimerase